MLVVLMSYGVFRQSILYPHEDFCKFSYSSDFGESKVLIHSFNSVVECARHFLQTIFYDLRRIVCGFHRSQMRRWR